MILVVHESENPINNQLPKHWGLERCCFCREQTPFWTSLGRKPGDEVACCEKCAKNSWPEDVPSKRVWVRRESIVTGTLGKSGRPDPDQVAVYPERMKR